MLVGLSGSVVLSVFVLFSSLLPIWFRGFALNQFVHESEQPPNPKKKKTNKKKGLRPFFLLFLSIKLFRFVINNGKMEMTEITAIVNQFGIITGIVVILMYSLIKYVNLKLKLFAQHVENSLKPHYHEVIGTINEAETELGKIVKFQVEIHKKPL